MVEGGAQLVGEVGGEIPFPLQEGGLAGFQGFQGVGDGEDFPLHAGLGVAGERAAGVGNVAPHPPRQPFQMPRQAAGEGVDQHQHGNADDDGAGNDDGGQRVQPLLVLGHVVAEDEALAVRLPHGHVVFLAVLVNFVIAEGEMD